MRVIKSIYGDSCSISKYSEERYTKIVLKLGDKDEVELIFKDDTQAKNFVEAICKAMDEKNPNGFAQIFIH